MAYTEHEWATGETITAAKLNNIEEGVTAVQLKKCAITVTCDNQDWMQMSVNGYMFIDPKFLNALYPGYFDFELFPNTNNILYTIVTPELNTLLISNNFLSEDPTWTVVSSSGDIIAEEVQNEEVRAIKITVNGNGTLNLSLYE